MHNQAALPVHPLTSNEVSKTSLLGKKTVPSKKINKSGAKTARQKTAKTNHSKKKLHLEKTVPSKKSNKTGANTAGQVGRQSSSSCLASNCLDLAVAYIGLLRTKVANYQKQTGRLAKLGAASSSKSAKQAVFSNTLNQLITAGGGNVSILTCGSSTNNTGGGIQVFLLAIEVAY